MNELRARIPESVIKALARRTARLVELVDRATHTAEDKVIRDGGAQLTELLTEKMDELTELHAIEDDELVERVRAFEVRLRLAEAKVATWPIPKLPKAERRIRRPLRPTRPVLATKPAVHAKPAKGAVAQKPAVAAKTAVAPKPAVHAKADPIAKPAVAKAVAAKPRRPHGHTPSKPTKTAA